MVVAVAVVLSVVRLAHLIVVEELVHIQKPIQLEAEEQKLKLPQMVVIITVPIMLTKVLMEVSYITVHTEKDMKLL